MLGGIIIHVLFRVHKYAKKDSTEVMEGVTLTPKLFGNKKGATLTTEIFCNKHSFVLTFFATNTINFKLIVNVVTLIKSLKLENYTARQNREW